MLKLVAVIYIAVLISLSYQTSTPQSPFYDVGVVEFFYGDRDGLNSTQLLEKNLKEFIEIMDNAPSDIDLIVFPESTLNTMLTASEIPEPFEKISPCDANNYDEKNVVKRISCAAKKHRRYVVINITTKAKCPDIDMIAQNDTRNCSAARDEFSYYNTNVVFDRNGVVISRYRKYNLFGEAVDKPFIPTLVTFDTDFNVTFGHFICFDLMFRRPAIELVRTMRITDIIFPTMWFSELPFLTGVQVQQNWAYSNNVNLIAAGANYPFAGSTGSGVYAGRKGALVAAMYGNNVTKLHTASVPKINFPGNNNIEINHDIESFSKDEMKPLTLKRDQLDPYTVGFLNDLNGNIKETGISRINEFSCEYKLNITISNSQSIPHYQYAKVMFHGNRTFDNYADGGVVACALLACPTRNISSCGTRDETLQNIHVFNEIEITARFSNGRKFFYMPSTLDTSILPLQPNHFEYQVVEISSNQVEIKMKLINPARDLLVFGIYGRDFNLDDDEEDINDEENNDNGTASVKSNFNQLISILFACLCVRII